MRNHSLSAIPLVLAYVGCAVDPPEIANSASAVTVSNGAQLNGVQLNGIQLNGVQLNGVQLNGVQLNGIQLNGIQLNGVQLNGGVLTATGGPGPVLSAKKLDGTTLLGAELIGATLTGSLSNNTTLSLRIDTMVAGRDDTWFYGVSYLSGGAWLPLCGTDGDGARITAVALQGSWDNGDGTKTGGDHIADPASFTFACRNAALGKCVDWGYRPWATATDSWASPPVTVSLADAHQACTRAVRADYCGNGHSFTKNGTPVDIADRYGVLLAETVNVAGWKPEAEWKTDGARCIDQERWTDLYNLKGVQLKECFGWNKVWNCAKSFNHEKALLITRVGP